MHTRNYRLLFALSFFLIISSHLFAQKGQGVFSNNEDVGKVEHKGSVQYNAATQQYTITGAGAYIWGTHDEFQYAWRKLKGNFILQTRAEFVGKGVEPHRKIGWMIPNSLDSSSAMVLATVHGDGLTSLQYRKTQAGETTQDTTLLRAPDMIQL